MEPAERVRINAEEGEYFIELDCDGSDASGPVALADTSFHLYLYDGATLRLVVQAASAHGDRIHSVRHGKLSGAKAVLSASEDGRVRCWDPRQGLSKPVLELSDGGAGAHADAEGGGAGLFAVDSDGGGALVAAGGEARVLLWDVRMAGPALKAYEDVHTEPCTTVRFLAGQPTRLLTGSVDGLLCLLDGTRDAVDEDLVTTVCNAGDAVVRAGACGGAWEAPGQAGPYAYCVSGTDVVSVWSMESGLNCRSWGRICAHHDEASHGGEEPEDGGGGGGGVAGGEGGAAGARAEYLIDCVSSAAGALSVLAGTHAGEIFALPLAPEGAAQPGPCAVFGAAAADGARSGHRATVRACAWAEATGRLYTIGEDGLLCCWQADALRLLPADERGRAPAAARIAADDAVGQGPEDALRLERELARARGGGTDSEGTRLVPRRARARGAVRQGALSEAAAVKARRAAFLPWRAQMRAAARVNWLARVRAWSLQWRRCRRARPPYMLQ